MVVVQSKCEVVLFFFYGEILLEVEETKICIFIFFYYAIRCEMKNIFVFVCFCSESISELNIGLVKGKALILHFSFFYI